MDDPMVQECRGCVLDTADDFRAVALPYTKFFNVGEPNAIGLDWPTARVWAKVDGTLIVVYPYADTWQTATTGTPDADTPVGTTKQTYREAFWRVFDAGGGDRTALSPQFCYMFELCAPWNRVVVPYTDEFVMLHGVRDLWTLQERDPTPFAKALRIPTPATFPLRTLDEALAASRALNALEQEGFVVCDADFRRLKVKSPTYVTLHHAKDCFSPRHMADLLRRGERDEFLAYFPEFAAVFRDLQTKYQAIVAGVATDWRAVRHLKDGPRKDFAVAARGSRYAGALFQYLDGRIDTPEAYLRGLTEPAYLRLLGVRE
jgi:hypothetical protein